MARLVVLAMTATALLGTAPPARGEPMAFRMLANYSRATFKSDAPLETVVGNTAAEGITGTLVADPARPAEARGTVRVDMSLVRTGIDRRDADMRGSRYLDIEGDPANRWVTFEVVRVEIAGPLEPGRAAPVKIHGILTVKQRPVERVAEGTVTYVALTAEQVEAQKRFGFTSHNIKVRAKLATTFSDHGIPIPQVLAFKVANDILIETDITFVRQ